MVLLAYAPCIVFLISISLDSMVLMLRNLLPGDPEVLVSRESGPRMIFCCGRMFQIIYIGLKYVCINISFLHITFWHAKAGTPQLGAEHGTPRGAL